MLRRMLRQYLLEIPARMAGGGLRNLLLRRTRQNNLTAPIAAFGSQINHLVAATDHVEIV